MHNECFVLRKTGTTKQYDKKQKAHFIQTLKTNNFLTQFTINIINNLLIIKTLHTLTLILNSSIRLLTQFLVYEKIIT